MLSENAELQGCAACLRWLACLRVRLKLGRRHRLKRLFSTFPDGLPGLGLLLLRLTAGLNAFFQGAGFLVSLGTPPWTVWLIGLIDVVSGISLLIGLMTPAAAVLLVLGATGAGLPLFPPLTSGPFGVKVALVNMIALAVTVFFVGPGAFSLDAYLFGRREIIIPENPRFPKY